MALYCLLLATVAIASGQSNRMSRSQPMNSTAASISYRAIATAIRDDIYSLRFEFWNPGTEAVEVSTYEPFTAFSVIGTAGDKPLTVHQPLLNIPVKPTTLRLPPKTTVTVLTPIRLRISEGAAAGTNGFVWTIPHDRKSVSLQVKVEVRGPFEVAGPIVFE